MMDLELVTCPLDDFDNLFRIIKETYCMANNENPRLILVEMDKANKNTKRALDLLNKIIHYYDIPGAFDNEEVCKIIKEIKKMIALKITTIIKIEYHWWNELFRN